MNTLERTIIIICLFVPLLIAGQDKPLNFTHLSLENGLSQTSISCIIKDSRGYMWFGTEDGLNKYDGNSFTIYRHNPSDKESLSSSYINTIVEQEDGFLWIGTKNGLNYFDPVKEKFTRYTHTKNAFSLSHNEVNTLLITDKKQLLIGTPNGLNKFDGKSKFTRFKIKSKKSSYYIISIQQDKEGNLWVLSEDGLYKIKLNNDSFSQMYFQNPLEKSYKYTMLLDSQNVWIGTSKGLVKFNKRTQESNFFKFHGLNDKRDGVLSIIKGQRDTLLLGTHGGGLISFDRLTYEFKKDIHNPFNSLSLNSNGIRSLFLDEENILWLGTYGGGIYKHDPDQFKFKHYQYSPSSKNSLSEGTVRAILQDRDDELWVGTHGGLNRIDRETNSIKTYKYHQNKPSTISSNTVRALKEDSNGAIWVGTWSDGLNSFDKKTGKFTRYTNLSNRLYSIDPIRALEIDDQDNIWVGGIGLWQFKPKTKTHKSYFYDKKSKALDTYGIFSLYFDDNQSLWVGTHNNGLIHLNTKSGSYKKYFHNPKDSLSISHNYITSIATDKNGFLWAGTYGGGLNKLNISTGTFQHYNTSNGLLNDVIYGVLVDNNDHIWFTSNEGLSKLEPTTNQFTHYGVEYGIQSKEFNAGAYHKSKNDELFFGGINGFNAFYPNALKANNKVSDIVFTDFQLFDEERIYNTNGLFGKNISRLKHIKLNYDQNNFSLKFSELNYSNIVDNKYEYQLQGLNDDWHNLGEKRLITLSNLRPGEYILNVRAHNESAKKASLNITVLPSYWQTSWAYLFYAVIVLMIIFLLYKNEKKNLNARAQFELKIKNLENNIITSAQEQNRNSINSLPLKSIDELPINEKFLQRTIEIVESNLTDSNFDVERFANEMFMSKSQLFRKLKRITGHSTTEFIRLIRLKRAAQLLKGNAGTVAEVAYKVGFDNIGYFSKCFKELFGKTPSQYSK